MTIPSNPTPLLDVPLPLGNNLLTGEAFVALQLARVKAFQAKWEAILSKYEAIPESEQGDTVDIATGEVIEDNGHLLSMVTAKQNNLWNEAFTDPVPKPPPKVQYATKLPPQQFLTPVLADTMLLLSRSPTWQPPRSVKRNANSDDIMLLGPSPRLQGMRRIKAPPPRASPHSPLHSSRLQLPAPPLGITELEGHRQGVLANPRPHIFPSKPAALIHPEARTPAQAIAYPSSPLRADASGIHHGWDRHPCGLVLSIEASPVTETFHECIEVDAHEPWREAPHKRSSSPMRETPKRTPKARRTLTPGLQITGSHDDLLSAVSSVRYHGRAQDLEPHLPPPAFLLNQTAHSPSKAPSKDPPEIYDLTSSSP